MYIHLGFSQVVLMVNNPLVNAGDVTDMGLIPGKIVWRRKWEPTPTFLLENPMDRGTWRATVHMVTENQNDWSDSACTHVYPCKDTKDLYFENCKIPVKEIQDDTSRQIHIPCSWIGRKKYCQNEYTTTAIYRCSEIPIKSPITFFTELGQKKILKICMET